MILDCKARSNIIKVDSIATDAYAGYGHKAEIKAIAVIRRTKPPI